MTPAATVALDAMGGDVGPDVVLPAALAALKRRPELNIILVGADDVLRQKLAELPGADSPRLEVRHASQLVSMDEAPAHALRLKKDSSMRVAINLVHNGVADACVSAGNTGALMATARFVLKTLPGIDRPAICTAIPSKHGHTYMLDLGANVDSKAEHLLQFAIMGSELLRGARGRPNPRVGLLNVGEEQVKGNEQVKKAGALLQASDLNYIGFVEGDAVYLGDVDLVVCDGFVGNIALKSSEGVARLIGDILRAEFRRSIASRVAGMVAMPILKSFAARIDPRRYNGASLLGLNGIVIKSHGSADSLAFAQAIEIATLEVENNVPDLIRARLASILAERLAV